MGAGVVGFRSASLALDLDAEDHRRTNRVTMKETNCGPLRRLRLAVDRALARGESTTKIMQDLHVGYAFVYERRRALDRAVYGREVT